MNIKPLIAAGMIAWAVASYGNAEPPKGHLVTETYIVQQGDTLWNIGETYIQKNTGGARYLPEFISGIQEVNWDLFKGRKCGELHPGDQIKVNYFVK